MTATTKDMGRSPQLDLKRPQAEYTLHGRTALITGGASGIGYAIATEFVRLGVRVLIADISLEKGESAVSQLRDRFPLAHVDFEQMNVTSWGDQVRAFDAAWNFSARRGIDIVIPAACVAGESNTKSALEHADEGISGMCPQRPSVACLSVNIIGVFYTASLAIHSFTQSAQVQAGTSNAVAGHLLFLGSIAGYREFPLSAQYACSKFGVRGLWKSLRRTSTTSNGRFRTNIVTPGFVETPLTSGVIEHIREQGIRVARTEDVVAAVISCCCQHDINGRAIAVPASGGDYGLRAGAFNFDLCDDEDGMDGAVELNRHIEMGSFGGLTLQMTMAGS